MTVPLKVTISVGGLPTNTMGSPVSPVVANLYMENCEHRALTSAVNPPRLWKRYVDDTFVILQQSQKEEFMQHINSVDPSIKFTTKEPRQDCSLPFLDTLVYHKTMQP